MVEDINVARINRLYYWCQKVLPAVYDDSLSYYELLAKVVAKLNEVIEGSDDLVGQIAANREDIDQLEEDVAFLNSEFEKIKNGDYASLYIDALKSWLERNLYDVVSQIAKFVWFGITDTGRFCAYVPSALTSEIWFDTGAVYGTQTYGRLMIVSNVKGEGVIDNTDPYYAQSEWR